MSCYDIILDELKRREVAFTDLFGPFFICSVGAHLFNLANKASPIKVSHARAPDMRLHLMYVTPPGFGRSFFMRQFLDDWGVLGDAIPSTFESYMTQAGFTGTFSKDKSGTTQKMPGVIELYADGICATEEWAAMDAAMAQQHSLGLDSAVLDALDKGRVKKRMASGTLEIDTAMTLWASTQIGRFKMTGGFPRRLFFMEHTPSTQDLKTLRQAYIKGRDILFEPAIVRRVEQRVSDIKLKLSRLERIEHSTEFDEFLIKHDRIHYEWALYERLMVGYKVMREDFSKVLNMSPDSTSKVLLRRGMRWRDGLLAESEGEQMLQVVADAGSIGVKPNMMKELMVKFGSDFRTSEQMMRMLLSTQMIEFNDQGNLVLTELSKSRRR